MQASVGVLIFILLIIIVLIRSRVLKNQGIKAIEFGQKDKTDFILAPFALFYFYLIAANAFNFPSIPQKVLFYSDALAWVGVILCLIGFSIFIWSMISFKKSFRVGLVQNTSQGLITTGAFSISRNPIYVSFAMVLIGQFLIFPSWILLIYIFAGILTFNRQILKEEKFLLNLYGREYESYCENVRRYL